MRALVFHDGPGVPWEGHGRQWTLVLTLPIRALKHRAQIGPSDPSSTIWALFYDEAMV